jgi:hypothetical protein
VSDENTRLTQSAYEAFGRGDMAALAEVMADDIEWVNPGDPADDPNAGTFKGKEAVLGWFGGFASTLASRRSSHESSSPRTTRWYRWCTPRQRFGTPAARLSILRHTCGLCGMGSSPGSRAITTPQRRLPPTAWSSPARGTGRSSVRLPISLMALPSPAVPSQPGAISHVRQCSRMTPESGETLMARTAVSVRLVAGLPVALVDHARAERSGFDQV